MPSALPLASRSVLVSILALTALLTPTCSNSHGEDATKPRAPVHAGDPGPTGARLRIRLSGQLEGRLEPCGCASGQLGGLARRSFMLQQDSGFDVLLEGGNLISGATPLDEEKLLTALTVLGDAKAPYDAVGLGPDDFALSADLLGSFFEGLAVPLVTSDLRLRGDAEGATWPGMAARTLTVDSEDGAVDVRIASLARLSTADTELPAVLEELSPEDAWARALAAAPAPTDRPSFSILMVHGGGDLRGACEQLAVSLSPRPDLVVGVGPSPSEPLPEVQLVDGPDGARIPLVYTGTRGRYIVDITLAQDEQGHTLATEYESTPLEGSRTVRGAMESKDVKQLLLQHRTNVKEAGLREAMARQRPTATGAEYVGDQTCAGCHTTAHATWSKTAHAHAWKTLVDAEQGERYGWPVTHYPDCVSCHVVGYGERSGFVNPQQTPGLINVSCETCHGPASRHISGPTENGFEPIGPERCQTCHDYEQSPNFEWQEYWGKIQHGLEPWMKKD